MLEQNKFILVVEDDVELCNSVQGVLQGAGYKAVGAHDLRGAMMKIRNQAFACILLDIRLGHDSGEEIIENTKNRVESLNRDTPIVVISGFLDRETVESLAGKVQGALVKPFETIHLLDAVRKVVKLEE